MAITIRHTPTPKDAVTPEVLRRVLPLLPTTPNALAIKQAILLMYLGFFRQSSIAPPAVAQFDPTRHTTRANVWPSKDGLHVRLKWTKTLQRSCDAKVILLPYTNDQDLCPVRNHTLCEAHRSQAPGHAPYLAFDDGNPLTTRAIARAWSQAVSRAGLQPEKLTLHSLRRGGASFTYNDQRADLNDVMTQGTWRSMAVRDYIRPPDAKLNSVHRALQTL